MDLSTATIPYAYDEEDGAAGFRFRISDGERSLSASASDSENDEAENQTDLWTHVYIPDRDPAPYAESLVDEQDPEPEFVEIPPADEPPVR